MIDPYDYENRTGVLPVSWEMFHGLCKGLSQTAAAFDPDIILPILRGGIFPGTQIGFLLQAEVHPIRLTRREHDEPVFDKPRWFIEPPEFIKGLRVLIVDEISSTGETLALARKKALSLGAASVICAVLYAHARGSVEPDLIGLISDDLILNPWDREIFQKDSFIPHPEYVDALSSQKEQEAGSLMSSPAPIFPVKS
jgi:uncharacterized protein